VWATGSSSQVARRSSCAESAVRMPRTVNAVADGPLAAQIPTGANPVEVSLTVQACSVKASAGAFGVHSVILPTIVSPTELQLNRSLSTR
jgi:hypothetical protein